MSMRRDPDDDEKLREAWLASPAAALPDGFRAGVMREVRGLERPGTSQLARVEVAVRRGAIAAGFLALITGLLAGLAGVANSGDLLMWVRNYPDSLVEWWLVF